MEENNMKKYIIVACICLIALSFTGCDPYAGKRPNNYTDTKWVSGDPDIYFEVSDKYYKIVGFNTYGRININGDSIDAVVAFNMGRGVSFDDVASYHIDESGEAGYSPIPLFGGECKFGKDKLVVKITHNEAGLLPDDVKEITFVREPLE
jgi:hypothetical protein